MYDITVYGLNMTEMITGSVIKHWMVRLCTLSFCVAQLESRQQDFTQSSPRDSLAEKKDRFLLLTKKYDLITLYEV